MLNPSFLAWSDCFDNYFFYFFPYLGAFLFVILQSFCEEILLAHNKIFVLITYFLIMFLYRKIGQMFVAVLDIV
jgi:hypothetical protein